MKNRVGLGREQLTLVVLRSTTSVPFTGVKREPTMCLNRLRGRAVQRSVPRLERVVGRFVFKRIAGRGRADFLL